MLSRESQYEMTNAESVRALVRLIMNSNKKIQIFPGLPLVDEVQSKLTAAGALTGLALGGPLGAAAGALIGAWLGEPEDNDW